MKDSMIKSPCQAGDPPGYGSIAQYIAEFLVPEVSEAAESADRWNRLSVLLLGTGDSGPLVNSIREMGHFQHLKSEDDEISQIISNYWFFYYSNQPVLKKRLSQFRQQYQSSDPDRIAEAFLDWLLVDCVKTAIKEYRTDEYLNPHIYGYAEFDGLMKTIPDDREPDHSADSSVNFSSDKAQRQDDPVRFAQKNVVELALEALFTRMKGEKWVNKVKYNQPGLQLFNHLQDDKLEIVSANKDLGDLFSDYILYYVQSVHVNDADFQAAAFLASKHELAASRNDTKYRSLIQKYEKTKSFSKSRFRITRQCVELIANMWLAPLNKYMIAEICATDSRYADKLLSRYKNDFLGDIYQTVWNYQEDKDV